MMLDRNGVHIMASSDIDTIESKSRVLNVKSAEIPKEAFDDWDDGFVVWNLRRLVRSTNEFSIWTDK